MDWKVKPQVEYRRLGDEGIIFDPESSNFYRLPKDVAAVWEALTSGVEPINEAVFELAMLGLVTSSNQSEQQWPRENPTVHRHLSCMVYAGQGCRGLSQNSCKPPTCTWNGNANPPKCQ